ncbi:hypothetical protein AKJ37_00485 [candidate division MSBL1 archaeon SCGC-AAA259I09]|nr:hypothetical protein AKJ66_02380 [candidate division MSBL1 archaeon SCGC-AAA259E22]KXA98302.1 hypothetical protein AKJ37_00485 [candidate division MSBL1 archaeon SCGC-AAA259I09]KXA99741.1 hypothetical protein AKJ40_02515 [candidate division MSBL1 archaeon SCGC-AAA259M10]
MPWWDPLIALGYPGIFVLNFLGASSIVFPIPYTVALLVAGTSHSFNPLLLAAVAGLGSALGEFVGYGAGYAGRKVVGGDYERKFEAMLKIFERYGTPAIFLFALTPLPDDLLFIPLGLARYSFWKAFIPCVAGKFLMALILVYIGSAAGWAFGTNWITALITGIVLIVIIYAVLRLDWVKLADRLT